MISMKTLKPWSARINLDRIGQAGLNFPLVSLYIFFFYFIISLAVTLVTKAVDVYFSGMLRFCRVAKCE